jgi:hypothetical protein
MNRLSFYLLVSTCVVLAGCGNVAPAPVPDTKAQEAIHTFSKSTYASEGLRRIEEAKKNGLDESEGRKLASDMEAMQKIEFTSLSLSGTPSDSVVRATITIDGKVPADGKSVRYFRLQRFSSGDWQVRYEINEADYNKPVRIRG